MVLAQLEIPIATSCYLAEICRSAGVPFMLDPAPAVPLPAELLQSVTWLTPNQSEAQILLGLEASIRPGAAEEVIQRLLELGVGNVALKLGADGVFLAGKDVSAIHVPAFSVDAVDSTAAGDAFNGAFAYALTVRQMRPRDAAEFACAVAALSVTKHGAQSSMPTLREVEAFLAQRFDERQRFVATPQ
jgi:ribokinase